MKCRAWSARYPALLLLLLGCATPASAILFYTFLPNNGAGVTGFVPPRPIEPAAVAVPPGFCIEPVITGLTYPVAVFTDEKDLLYIVESGYAYGEDFAAPRLLRLERDGKLTEVTKGEQGALWTGASFHKGDVYLSEGFGKQGGRILKITRDGKQTVLVDGIPSQGDHHTNKPVVGPDGYVYFGVGTATNSGVVGQDNADFGWLKRHPELCDIPPVNVTLTGQNFATVDALHPESGRLVMTGAYSPYGTPTTPGQVIPGRLPCNGAVLRVPANGGKLELVAWGFRNPFGLTFAPDGTLYCTDNQFDERGSRPVYGAEDLLWKVQPGVWYGWPDYWGNIPICHPRFAEKKKEQPVPGFLLACHPNVPPEPVSWLAVRSSSDGLDISRNPAFGYEGEIFIAVFGDIVNGINNGKVRRPVGCRVIRVNPCTGVQQDFVINRGEEAGPGSKECNGGIERPVDLRFNNDGSLLYIADFGVMTVNEKGPVPYRGTGVVWRVRRECGPEACLSGPGGTGPAGKYRRGEPIGRPVVIKTEKEAFGQVVYAKHCYQCHQGGEGGLGPALLQLAPGPIVRTQIRLGLGVMPAFSHAEIDFHEMNALIDYIRASRFSGPPYNCR